MQYETEPQGTSHKINRTPQRPTSGRRVKLVSATVTFTLCLCLLLLLAAARRRKRPRRPGHPRCWLLKLRSRMSRSFEEWVAQLNGPVNADITPKVQGYLLKQDYQNGYFVKKGQLLFELDPRQYQAAVEQAQAQVESGSGSAF